MKKGFCAVVLSAALSACQSTDLSTSNKSERAVTPIDLTQADEYDAFTPYWTLVKRYDPRYPTRAALKGHSGCATLRYTIGSDGKAHSIKAIKSYPRNVFDSRAIKAMRKWRWEPTDSNLEKAPVLAEVQLDFSLEKTKNRNEAVANCGESLFHRME
ncbi:energy transducer TonB [Agaribacter marinus]|uniref:Protein TonB n=1 Tax=Agaribacter marinus TaxID=1431249 RepID=A0AA37WGU8_9ALTE|nr:energy transducer TonB [Agaribacter marinus]GLR69302.1 hypothetical protein GCM10007852_02100 [Agaribacter marinus]